jgi:hypothetical protein
VRDVGILQPLFFVRQFFFLMFTAH